MTKGVIIHCGREPVTDINVPTVTTFSLPASSEMAPVTKILVWVIAQDGQLISHSVSIPVNPLGKHEVVICFFYIYLHIFLRAKLIKNCIDILNFISNLS